MKRLLAAALLAASTLAHAQVSTVEWHLTDVQGKDLGTYASQTACDAAAKAKTASNATATYTCPRMVKVVGKIVTPTIGTVTVAFTPDMATDFLNPERGFIVSPVASNMTVPILTRFVDYWNVRLFRYTIELAPYVGSALPQSFLDDLNTQFAAGRAAGVKFIVQTEYTSSVSGADAPLATVLQHISQLKPVLAQNADVIPFIVAGYIGVWGEWNTSTNDLLTDANKATIQAALLANTPASTVVQFRRPDDISIWYPGNPAGAAAARVGLHNDCYMANDTDAHTYTGLTDPLRDYIKKMSEVSVVGGETCENVSNPEQMRLTCAQALSEHAAYHMTWLSKGYAPTFINSWRAGGCLDQISRMLGYRLQLDKITHPASVAAGQVLIASIDLRNVGWAKLFSKRPLVLSMVQGSTVYSAVSTVLLSSLPSQAASSTTLSVSITVPAGAPKGDYQLQLSAPDIYPTTAGNAAFSIQFANTGAYDATTGRFATGTKVAVQ